MRFRTTSRDWKSLRFPARHPLFDKAGVFGWSGDQEIRRHPREESGAGPTVSGERLNWLNNYDQKGICSRIYSIIGWCDIPRKASSDLMNKPRRRTGQSSQNYFLSFSNGTYKPCLVLFISCYFVMSSLWRNIWQKSTCRKWINVMWISVTRWSNTILLDNSFIMITSFLSVTNCTGIFYWYRVFTKMDRIAPLTD